MVLVLGGFPPILRALVGALLAGLFAIVVLVPVVTVRPVELWELLDGSRGLNRRALPLAEALLGPDHPEVAWNLRLLGLVLAARGRDDEAEALAARAAAIRAARGSR